MKISFGAKERKKMMIIILSLIIFAVLAAVAINLFVIFSTEKRIFSLGNMPSENKDAILVLGAGVRKDGSPSPMLEDRLLTAYKVYSSGVSDKIIVSGDHTKDDYDEVKVMKEYLSNLGVPQNKIYEDHAGVSTYDSVIRAKEVFGAKSLHIVTQRYHLFRAIFIADKLGIDSDGCETSILSTNATRYKKQIIYSSREFLARIKDAFMCINKPDPKYRAEYTGFFYESDK